MENRDAKLIKWAKDRIDAEFKGDIALLIGLKGACKLPEDAQDMAFDYFVPATERGYQMAKTFVIEGMGYDLYPNSYERLARIADLQEPNMIFVLDKGEILYSKNKEEEDKFIALKTLLHQNLADKDKTYQVALEYLNTAMEIFKVLMFEEKMYKVRKAAGGIASFLSHAIALINGKYIVNVYGNLSVIIEALERRPVSYVKTYKSLIECKNKEEIKIPKVEEKKQWGEGSGARRYYEDRNNKIKADYRAGLKITALADKYGLSEDRIRRIVNK